MRTSAILTLVLISFRLAACDSLAQKTEIGDQRATFETYKLYVTAKIWGFLKYYHPNVVKGNFNWDDQLKELLVRLRNVETRPRLSEKMLAWIETLGEVTSYTSREKTTNDGYFDKNFDLSWLQDSTFVSKALSQRLQYILQNRVPGRQHYVAYDYARHFKLINEPVYPASRWVDDQFRLLILFKYWNVVEYFYPYKYLTDQPWNTVLLEMIPKFVRVSSETDFHLKLLELTIKLDDSHSFLETTRIKRYFGEKYIPAKFKLVDGYAVITAYYDNSLAAENDIQMGDLIVQVNGERTDEVYERNRKYVNGSNASVKRLRYGFRAVLNGNTDSVSLTLLRNDTLRTRTIKRYSQSAFRGSHGTSRESQMLDHDIGYLNLDGLEKKEIGATLQSLKKSKVIIVDVRNYPEFILDELAGFFSSAPGKFVKYIIPDLSHPGRFKWREPVKCGKRTKKPYQGQVIVLINEETQSWAESVCMCLQAVRHVVTIGRQTSGANGDVSDFVFFENASTLITGLGVFYPNGAQTQRTGIEPDIRIEATIENASDEQDEILDKAIEVARKLTTK